MEHRPEINDRVVVIGGVNMDIGGSPAGRLILHDSNPGSLSLRAGGVGRNIAHNLRLLGVKVSLIAAVGGDMYGECILESCAAAGLDMGMARILPERRSSVYLYVNDEGGDMAVAIADMDICREISPEYLAPLMERINSSAAVVLDANLEAATIEYIAANCTAPLYADPVSTAKAPRLRNILGRLSAIKPNAIEAETLTGESDPERAAQALVDAGVKQVFVSMGSRGMIAAEKGRLTRLAAAPAEVVNTTGAGDAAMAAIVRSGMLRLSLEKTAENALRAGSLTAECPDSNTPRLKEIFA